MNKKTKVVPAVKLGKAFLAKVEGPICQTWQEIGSDSYALARECGERMTNRAAIEGCIDADRLTTFCGVRGREADAAVSEAIKAVGYDKMFNYLCRNIKLV